MSEKNIMTIHLIVVEIFQSGPEVVDGQIDPPTNIATTQHTASVADKSILG